MNYSQYLTEYYLFLQLNILASFETRIHKLEDTIVPVHKETIDLQRRQNSILVIDFTPFYHHPPLP